MKITIKHRTQAGWLVWLLVLFPFLLGTLNDLLGFPYVIRYVLDLIWLTLLVFLLLNKHLISKSRTKKLCVWICLFLIYTLLVYLVQFQSPLYYLWGVRNNFRFYVAFFAFAAFLQWDDIESFLRIFDKLFWINALVSLFQYVVLGIEQDYLGGIFGTEIGCNGYTNIFLLIIVTKSLVFYLQKKESISQCFCKCAASILVAALAELKFYFVEFLLVVALASLFTNFSWRKLWVILGGVLAAFVGAALLSYFFPLFVGWFSLEWILEVATATRGYTSQGDLNRLTAIISINDLWLDNWGMRLFGLGMGNCDTSSYAFLNTPFFIRNGDMHYSWMSYAQMYLECGWIGLVFYFGFYAAIFFGGLSIEKQVSPELRDYCRIARIMAILCVPISIYNSSLRMESGYMMYFILAIPFSITRNKGYTT